MTSLEVLGEQIRNLEQQGRDYTERANEAAKEEQAAIESLKQHKATMKFFDKWLFGWFADKSKVSKRNELKRLCTMFNISAAENRNAATETAHKVQEQLTDYLMVTDEQYQTLHRIGRMHEQMKSTVESFSSKISSAKSAVSSAKGMEVVDMFSKNKGIAILSSMQNSAASSRISEVKSALPAFKKAVENYSNEIHQFDASHISLGSVNDTLDLVTDLAFGGGFDFMSVFQLSKLSAASSNLASLSNAVTPVRNAVENNSRRTAEALDSYRQKTYQLAIKSGL